MSPISWPAAWIPGSWSATPDPPPGPPGAVPGHTRRGRAPLLPDPCRPQAQSPHFSPGRWILYERLFIEPFAKFARKRDLLSGRVVVPGKPMASQVQIPFEGVILQEHSAPISCPTPNFAKGSIFSTFLPLFLGPAGTDGTGRDLACPFPLSAHMLPRMVSPLRSSLASTR